MSWDDRVTHQAVAEGGLGLINAIHITLLNCFLGEIKSSEKKVPDGGKADDDDEDHLLIAIKQHIDKQELLWPELLRLIIRYKNPFDINQHEGVLY